MIMRNSAAEYADYAEYDRRQRGIVRHVLMAFLGGVVVGLGAMLPAGPIAATYDPYAYLALTIVVGATASGFLWALLTVFLATASSVISAMGVASLGNDFDLNSVGGGASGLNTLVVMLVGVGLLAYAARSAGIWGDLAAAGVTGLLIADLADRSIPGHGDFEPGFWPWSALGVGLLALALAPCLRRTRAGRTRTLLLAPVLSALLALAVRGPLAG